MADIACLRVNGQFRSSRRKCIVKKINLILLSLMAAVPAGYLVYLMVMALTLKHIWDKKVLGGLVVVTAFAAVLVALWPLIYALAFYADKPKAEADEPAAGTGSSDAVETVGEGSDGEAQEFHQEDLDAFDGQEIPVSDDDEFGGDDDFEAVESGSEFDLDEDDVAQAETAEFAIADDFDEIEDFEDEEEAPKKKPKKKKK